MRLMRSFLFVVLLVSSGFAVATALAETHPFSIHDMLAMDRRSRPQKER